MIPTLLHPVPVEIQRAERSKTVFDALAREPVRQLWRAGTGPGTSTVLELEAQVNWNNEGGIARPRFHPGGVEEDWSGYLLLRVTDLVSAGAATENADGTVTFNLLRGDRITRIGRRVVNLYILFFRDVAAYPDQGGGTLLEVTFGDRLGA